MIDQIESRLIASALNIVARDYPERFRVRFSGGGESPFSANPLEDGFKGITCPAQTGKTKNCGTCGLICATSLRPINFEGHARSLKNDHPAIVEGTTVFMNSKLTNLDPSGEKSVLKQSTNSKLGRKVEKGSWKGYKFLTLTLTERETCPVTCPHWNDCYGNNMHLAKRISTNGLMEKIESDLSKLNPKHNYAIRLHVLGDFYSVEYVEFWAEMLEKFPNIRIYGYTAHPIDNSHLFADNELMEVA